MVETTDTSKKPAKRAALLPLWVLLGLAALGAAAWWFGPWSEDFRYSRSSLLSLSQIVDANPKNVKAARYLALRLAGSGDGALAEPALRRALDLDPTDPEVGTGLGELLIASHRVPEAFQVLKAVVNNHPEFNLGRMALGRLYSKQGSFLHAAEQFQAVIKTDPKFTDAWYELAVADLQMQKGADARSAIAEAIRQSPNEAHYLALKSSIDAAVGATNEGIETAKKAAELAPKEVKVQVNYANILLAHYRGPEDLQEADRTIAHLEQLDPRLRILPFQKGELARRRQNWTEARTYLEQAVQAAPNMDEAYFSLSTVYQRLGMAKEAEKVLAYYRRRQFLRQQINDVGLSLGAKPDDVTLHVRLADLQLEAGEGDAAISTLRNALRLDPKSIEVQKRLAKLTGPAPSAGSAGAADGNPQPSGIPGMPQP